MQISVTLIILVLMPTILVAGVVYILFRQFFSNQQSIEQYKLIGRTKDSVLPLKLQAYERLMLFCERIMPQFLILRLKTPGMSAKDLQSALVLGIQQEFEHNISQQLYVSDRLWEIVNLAKNQWIEIVTQVAANLKADASADDLAQHIFMFLQSQKKNPVETAKRAIKREAGLLLG